MKIDILENNNISYKIKPSRGHSFRLRFDASGILNISFPIGSKESSLVSFIEKNIDWVIEKSKITSEKKISYENGSSHYYLGEEYQLIINYSKTNRLDVIDKKILVSVSKIENVKKLILKWRFDQAEIIFQEILFRCFDLMKKDLRLYPSLIIKASKSKWGCCYFKENKIMLNVALTQVPIHLIEYVVCHELTHFVIHNHSKEFHAFLEGYIQDERKCMHSLKKYSSIL